MRTFYLVTVWLHIVAAMAWIGGMVLFVTVVMPRVRRLDDPVRLPFLRGVIGRFRRAMWIAFGVLGLTGALNVWLRGVDLSDVMSAEWRAGAFGHLVIAKLVLFLAAAGVVVLHERIGGSGRTRWLGRVTLVIGLIMVAIGVVLVRGA